jgi:hypothetical protein
MEGLLQYDGWKAPGCGIAPGSHWRTLRAI